MYNARRDISGLSGTAQLRVYEAHIEVTGHIPELFQYNVFDAGHAEDSIPVVEEIERRLSEEEHSGPLGN